MVAIGLLVLGYAVLYWGIHHFPPMHRYSLWTLLGIDNFITPNQSPIQFGKGGGLTP